MGRNRTLVLVGVALLAFALGGCSSDQNAPVTAAHAVGWILVHGSEAQVALGSCTTCHGPDFAGNGDAVSCFECHFDGPPFGLHPANWADPRLDHQGFPHEFIWTRCSEATCHGEDLGRGAGPGPLGPSCFLDAFGNQFCHADGPPVPHSLPYFAARDHGREARDRQGYCRNCHGRPVTRFDGGFVADPAILARTRGNCSAENCHPAARAHPTNWQGDNDTEAGDPDPSYSSNHRAVRPAAIGSGCALCHETEGPGNGPLPGAPSCFASEFTNAGGSGAECHGQGFGVVPHPAAAVYRDPAEHGADAKVDLGVCQNCHGELGTPRYAGGVAAACSACHPAAEAHPTRWQGQNDDGPDPDHFSSHRDAAFIEDCRLCHSSFAGQPSPVPGAPNCLSAAFTNADGVGTACHLGGPGASPVHPDTWPNGHVFAARTGVDTCLAECHTDTRGITGGIPGCAACHLGGADTTSRLVHPDGDPLTPDFGPFMGDAVPVHGGYVGALGGDATSCALGFCHGSDLMGGVAPENNSWGNAPSCYLAVCHLAPPITAP